MFTHPDGKKDTNPPIKGRVYTLKELHTLDLWDSPHLGFVNTKGAKDTVQDSHLTTEELLALPGWADTKWEYIFRTREWCEIFRAVDYTQIQELVEYYDNGYGDILSRPKPEVLTPLTVQV